MNRSPAISIFHNVVFHFSLFKITREIYVTRLLGRFAPIFNFNMKNAIYDTFVGILSESYFSRFLT